MLASRPPGKGPACYLRTKGRPMGQGRDSGGGTDGGGVARPTAEGWELGDRRVTLAPITIPGPQSCPCPSEIRMLIPEYLAAPSMATEAFPSRALPLHPFFPLLLLPLLLPAAHSCPWSQASRLVAGQSNPGGGEEAVLVLLRSGSQTAGMDLLWGTSCKDPGALKSSAHILGLRNQPGPCTENPEIPHTP